MTPSLAAALARIRAVRDAHPDDVKLVCEEATRLSRACGPLYRMHDGRSEYADGHLWELLTAWDGWTNSDLVAMRKLGQGERVQLSADGIWVERLE